MNAHERARAAAREASIRIQSVDAEVIADAASEEWARDLRGVRDELEKTRQMSRIALEVMSGGDAQGLVWADAVAALRVACGESEVGGRWSVPVSWEQRQRLGVR